MEDRISHLPDHVLHDILSLLSKKDATKTSILSKHWNCVWNSFPILAFYDYNFSREIFCDSVDRTIQRRYKNLIFTETLNIWISQRRGLKHLDSWIECLVTLKLSQLNLGIRLHANGHGYVLPQCVWNSQWLRVLRLYGCGFSGSNTSGMIGIGSSLRKLRLESVRIDESTFHQVISSCFHLEDLEISYCVGFKVLKAVGLKEIRTVFFNLSVDQSVFIEAPGLQFLRFCGRSSNIEQIIQASFLKKLKDIFLFNMVIDELDKFIPELPLLEKLWLDRCELKESFALSSGRLVSFSLTDCENVKHIKLDTCCLNKFSYDPKFIFGRERRLDITWIAVSEEIEICHEIGSVYHNSLYGISFDKIAMYLVNLRFCKFLTIVYDQSKWIEPEAAAGLSFDIEQLRIKRKWRGRRYIGPSCLLIVKELLRRCRRPSSVLIEVGNCKDPVASFMKLDFFYQQEEIDEGQVINTKCDCGGSSCWRCCLGELQISHSLHAVTDTNATKLVEFVKDNALRLKKISHSKKFDCCFAPQMQVTGHSRHLVLRFP